MMEKNAKIYVAGHRGMVGSAIVRELERQGYTNIITRTHNELDLTRQDAVEAFFAEEKPEYVFLAAAKVGGIVANGAKGAGKALKDFSLPLSMSFRLFGALLSGLLVTELVYYYVSMSFVLPVIIAVLFTMLHALIQAYVLTTLTSMFYGESTEKHAPKPKKSKKIKNIQTVNN